MIKIEEENNQTYGIEAEEIDKIRIQELSYQISKLKRDIEKVSVGVTISSESSLTTDSPHFQNNPSLESQSKEYQVYESVSKAKKKEEVQKKVIDTSLQY